MTVKKSQEKIEVEQKNIEEIKMEVLEYAEKKIDLEVEEAIRRAEKKLISQKNYSILKRNIIIIILSIISLYLAYQLYNMGYFDKNKNENINISENNPEKKEDITKNNLETGEELSEQKELINEYQYLLKPISINEDNKYLTDYYSGNLTTELKLSLSMNLIEEERIITEEDSTIIKEEDMKAAYEKIFEKESYKGKTFTYNNLSFKYLKSQSIYIANGFIKKQESNIKKIPIEVIKDNNEITINVIEFLIKENKAYNITNNEEIEEYKDDNSIINNQDMFTKMKYTFICEKDNCSLKSLKNTKE